MGNLFYENGSWEFAGSSSEVSGELEGVFYFRPKLYEDNKIESIEDRKLPHIAVTKTLLELDEYFQMRTRCRPKDTPESSSCSEDCVGNTAEIFKEQLIEVYTHPGLDWEKDRDNLLNPLLQHLEEKYISYTRAGKRKHVLLSELETFCAASRKKKIKK